MFKNIQKYLLLNYPLLWNLKIVPTTVILVLLNVTFLIIGFANGAINFNDSEEFYSDNSDPIVIFFSVLVAVLSLIIWLVYYFKNNAFKSFYSKNSNSLYQEWVMLFFTALLLCSFPASYYFGKDMRVRTYFTKEEAQKRCDILSTGSFFIDGSYTYYPEDYTETVVETAISDTAKQKDQFFIYKGKKYKVTSLLNKGINSYSFFGYEQDSIRKEKIKTWLVTNDKTAIKKALKDYLSIAKLHKLHGSIDENQWFELIYDYPNYVNYKRIASKEKEYYGEYTDYQGKPTYDTTSQYVKTIGNEKYVFNKYFLPESHLKYNYSKIADAWASPTVNSTFFLVTLYFAMVISLLLFSFRVTSGKSWLINFVVLGVLNILLGIFTVIISSEYTYPTLLLIFITIALLYFLITTYQKKSKNISAITLNTSLWTLPAIAPIIYYLVLQYLKDLDGYDYSASITFNSPYRKTIQFMEENSVGFFYFNLLFVIIVLFFITIQIKKWKGIAEE